MRGEKIHLKITPENGDPTFDVFVDETYVDRYRRQCTAGGAKVEVVQEVFA